MEFQNIGEHCEMEYCKLKDFLPFKCVGCKKWFCNSHIHTDSHNCQNANHESVIMIICPLCLGHLKTSGETDINLIFDKHMQEDCDQAYEKRREEKKKKKKKCPVQGCKKTLNLISATTCSECGNRVCLEHRYPDKHNCVPGEKRRSARMALKERIRNQRQIEESKRVKAQEQKQMEEKKKKELPKAKEKDIENSKKEEHKTHSTGSSVKREICDVCGKSFNSIMNLLSHAQVEHQTRRQEEVREPRVKIGVGPREEEKREKNKEKEKGVKVRVLPSEQEQSRGASSSQIDAESLRILKQYENLMKQEAQANSNKEKCPVCNQFFNTISDLITHSAIHDQTSQKTPSTTVDRERCPICTKIFSVIDLVSHVQTQHS